MTRFGYVMATAAVAQAFIVLFIAVAIFDPIPRLIWNASASAPIGLYRIDEDDDPPAGALVAVMPPAQLSRWLSAHRYLPEGVPLLKHVVAKAGHRVCRTGAHVTVDGLPVGDARTRDSQRRPLPVWQGCRTLRDNEIFVMNTAIPDSLDGRYFGPVATATLLGRATPLLTRDAPEAPLTWRGVRP